MKEPSIRPHNREIDELYERYRRAPGSHVFAPLADAYRKLGLVDEALDICARGLSANPRYASGYVVQGKCQFDAGRADRAQDSFKKVLEIDPQNLVALRYLGIIRASSGDAEGARGYFERILVLDPGDKEIQQRLDAITDTAAPPTLVDEIEEVLQPERTRPPAPKQATTPPPPAPERATPAPARKQAMTPPPPAAERATPAPTPKQATTRPAAPEPTRSDDDVIELPDVPDEFEGSPILLGDESVTTEYIATVTLADIFAAQGYAAKALKIYRDVLRRQPDNEDVKKKIAALEQGEGAKSPDAPPTVELPRIAEPPRTTEPPASDARPTPRPAPVREPSPSLTPSGHGGGPLEEGRSYEQFKRWLRSVSD